MQQETHLLVHSLGVGLRVGKVGYHASRRCSTDTYPGSYITNYTSIRRPRDQFQFKLNKRIQIRFKRVAWFVFLWYRRGFLEDSRGALFRQKSGERCFGIRPRHALPPHHLMWGLVFSGLIPIWVIHQRPGRGGGGQDD